jgi:hypothetical protein
MATVSNWLAGAYSALKSPSGDWLAYSYAAKKARSHGGSVSSFLSRSSSFANLLETSMQTQMSSINDIYARQALLRVQEENFKALEKALAEQAAEAADESFAAKPPETVTTGSSATIDFETGIMTMRDGTLIDIKSGLKLDPITKLPYSVGYAIEQDDD